MSTLNSDSIIKTTARFQEVSDPLRQRPIIKIDSPVSNTTTTSTTHLYNNNNNPKLPNTIRSSLDSGRDNPFRPDGEIYKSADPIVDYYKHGANQSRTQSPTDSQLLLNGANGGDKNKTTNSDKQQKKQKKQKKKCNANGEGGADDEEEKKKSCWKRWFCCCCCCCKKKKLNDESMTPAPTTTTTTNEKTTLKASLTDFDHSTSLIMKDSKQSKIVVVSEKPVQLPTQPKPPPPETTIE